MNKYRYQDAELVALVKDCVSNSQTHWESDIAKSRDRAYDYYYGKRPYAQDGNTSDYVSQEVFDSVEGLKAKLLRVFRSTRDVVRFVPVSEADVDNAQLRTEYVKRIFNKNGYKILHDCFHDGLLSRLATVKRSWSEREVIDVETFTDVPTAQAEAFAANPEVVEVIIEAETEQVQVVPSLLGPIEQMVPMASGTVRRKRMERELVIEVIPPENVFIPEYCTDLGNLDSCAIRYDKPKYQLIQDGYDPEVVAGLSGTSGEFDSLKSARDGDRQSFGRATDERELVTVYEAYLPLDMTTPKGEPSQGASLYQIVVCGDKVLSVEAVAEIPLRFWSPVMVAHKAIGMSIADVTMDIQSSVTNAVRGMLDNVHRVNAGVRIADMELIRNPRDLIDNPIGGVINSPDMNAVSVIPQPQVSSATGSVLEILSQQKEMRTGDTRLGKGLETQNIVTHQNSGDMIDQLINVGNERPLQMARAFAELCLMPLLLDIYRIGYENKYVVRMEVNGEYQDFDPTSIPYADEMEIDVAITPEYGQQRAAQLAQMHGTLMQNPAIGPLYTLEEQYAVMSEIFGLMGMANWLANPKDPKVQRRIQSMQQEGMKKAQMSEQLTAKQVELEERKVVAQERQVDMTAKARKEELDLNAAKSANDSSLKEREFAWKQQVDLAEFKIEKEQKRPVSLGAAV